MTDIQESESWVEFRLDILDVWDGVMAQNFDEHTLTEMLRRLGDRLMSCD